MSYTRVIPRDLFNEAKLLKCLGIVTLSIHSELLPRCLKMDDRDIELGFEIHLCDEGLYVSNLRFWKQNGEVEEEIGFYSPYNSRECNPLHFIDNSGEAVNVFTENGAYSQEFIDFLKE